MRTNNNESNVPRTKSCKTQSTFKMPSERTMFRKGYKKRYLNCAVIWLHGTKEQVDAELAKLQSKADERDEGLNMKDFHKAYYRKKKQNQWAAGVHGI